MKIFMGWLLGFLSGVFLCVELYETFCFSVILSIIFILAFKENRREIE